MFSSNLRRNKRGSQVFVGFRDLDWFTVYQDGVWFCAIIPKITGFVTLGAKNLPSRPLKPNSDLTLAPESQKSIRATNDGKKCIFVSNIR